MPAAGSAPITPRCRARSCEGSEPVAVARALCAVCRTRTLYVADLDALAGKPADEATLSALGAVAEPWVDAGATTPERAAALERARAARNVIGTESIGRGRRPPARQSRDAACPAARRPRATARPQRRPARRTADLAGPRRSPAASRRPPRRWRER